VTVAVAYAGAVFEVLRRDLLVFASYRARLFTQILAVFFSMALFYYISRLVSVQTFESPDAYFGFVVAGLVIFRVLMSSFNAATTGVRQQLVAGTFERNLVSPFGAVAGVASLLLFPFVLAFVLGAATLALAGLVFGMDVQWDTLPLAIPLAFLAALAFSPFALVLAAAGILFKQTTAGAGFILSGISLIAGFYFPVALLPDWIQWTSDVQPFTPAVELLRNVVVGTPLENSALSDVLKLVGFSAVLLPLSFLVLKGAILIGRRRATIIEY
jgi:ABC-2 type transport system permease protein